MIYSIQNKKINLCNGDLSLHVLNIIDSIHKSAKTGKKQKITNLCDQPKPFNSKSIKKITNK